MAHIFCITIYYEAKLPSKSPVYSSKPMRSAMVDLWTAEERWRERGVGKGCTRALKDRLKDFPSRLSPFPILCSPSVLWMFQRVGRGQVMLQSQFDDEISMA